MSALTLAGAKRGGAEKLIAHSHSTNNTKMKSPIKKFISIFLKRKLNKLATQRIGCGQAAGEFLFGNNPFTVVPNGIDIERYKFSESLRDKLRGQYKISKSTSVWLTIGRLEEVKNQEFLIDLLKDHFIDSNETLFIIGNGSLHDNLQNQINNSSLSNRVYLLPARDDVNEYYSMADFFVLPSLFEGVPTVGIEAQANGLKCIFSDRVAKEVAVSENSLFLPLDQDIWAKELKKKPKGIKYRNNLQDKSIQAYNIKMTVKKLEEIYDI